jgi:hypothetical protein
MFVRTEFGVNTASLMKWARSWNRLIGWYDDDERLFSAILAGEPVETPWATYLLQGFERSR